MGRKYKGILAAFLVAVVYAVIFPAAQPAAADTPYSPIFSTNATGDITYVSNTVATCRTGSAGCAAAQAGGSSSNNGFAADMVLIDVDGDATTTTSSTGDYVVPTGGSVIWAGLFWAGYYTGPDADKQAVKFATPAGADYSSLSASFYDEWSGNDNYYTGFVDVTPQVQSGGSGTYGVADISVTAGTSATYGGWTLIIVEADPAEPWRNLTVNRGFNIVRSGGTIDVPVTGFTAPPVGPVTAEVGIVASEGDISFAGDYAELNGTRLSNASNPENNFFNSSLTDNGAFNTAMNPSYPANTFGFDADIVDATGLIGPGDTSATVSIGTNGDGFFPTAVTTAIDIYVPNLTANFVKAATDLNGEELHPGDIIEYSLSFDNLGEDPSIETTLTDSIPAGTTYLPGSLRVVQDDSPAGPRSDAAGDDTAWFDGSNVNFNLGVDADAATGGEVAPVSQGGRLYQATYQVTVNEGTERSDVVNTAEIDYVAKFINEPFKATSNETSDPVTPLVDLALDKTAFAESANAGEQIIYTLAATNGGPSPADNVVITDTLPVGTTFDAAASSPECSANGLDVTCTFTSLAAGDTINPIVVVDTNGDLEAADICNLASVESDTHEHDVTNNADRVCTEIERLVDLTVEKLGPATVTAGNQISYDISLSNLGPSDAQNVILSDALPSGATFVSATPSGSGSCAGAVSCTWSEVEAGSSENVTVSLSVPSSTAAGSELVNRVTVTSDDPETNLGDNTDSVTTTVETSADLAASKAVTTAQVVAGGQISFDISATNNGPSDALDVVLSDGVPAGLTYNAAASATECSLSGSTVACPIGTLAAGAAASISVVFDVPSSVADGAIISNTVSLSTTTDDPNPGNDQATVTAPVVRQADLAIVKDDGVTTIDAGEQITYTINYSNDGPSEASGVVISDSLPAGTTFASSSACGNSGSTVTCNLGLVSAGASGSVSYVVDTDPNLDVASSLVNSASVAGNEADPNPANNESFVSTDVARSSELTIEKSDLADPVVAGTAVTYEVVVTNLGPSVDTGVQITDSLPAGLSFVATSDPVNCSETAGTVTCNVGALARFETYSVQITAAAAPSLPAGTLLSNTASADGNFSNPVDDTEETTIAAFADLAVQKSAPTAAFAGNSLTYVIDVRNSGPSDAQNVTITDTLPGGTTYAGFVVSAGSATCSNSGSSVVCNLGTLANGAMTSIEISVLLDEAIADGTSLENRIAVSSDTADPTPGNNTDTAATTVSRSADLELTKTTLTTPIVAGESATFELTVSNAGPSIATGVTVNDTLPTGFTFQPAGSDAACLAGVTCTAGTIEVGDSVTFVVAADAAASLGADTYTNSASAGGAEADPNSANNNATNDVVVQLAADLEITKTGDDAGFIPGTTETYTIAVTNNGPSDAAGVEVTDTLPPGLTFNSAGSDSTCVAGVTCSLGTVPAGDTVNITLAVDIDAGLTGAISNTVEVSSETPDPTPGNNSNTDITPAQPNADLSISKSAAATAVAGESLSYTITVRNDGPSDATNTIVSDLLPAGLTFEPAGSSPACSAAGQTVTCNVGTMSPTDVLNITINANISETVIHATGIKNDAMIESDVIDPDPSGNYDSVETTIERETDLTILKEASVSEISAGNSFAYTLTVNNGGPSVAGNVLLSDTFPAGITATSVTTNLGLCSNGVTSVGCSVPALAPGETMTVEIGVIVDSSVLDGTRLGNTASIETSDPETDETNNSGSVDVLVRASADLAILKEASTDTVVAGETIGYTITVSNDGPSDAQTVEVSDTVASALSIDSVTSAEFSCAVGGQVVTCDLEALAAGESATVTIDTTVAEDTSDGASISNTAAVSSATDDPVVANNSSTATSDVAKEIDLALEKTTSKSPVVAGEPQPYQVTVTNAGPSSATNVVVVDNIPAGTTLNTALSDAACSAAGAVVTCDVASILAAQSVTINIVVDIPADFEDGATITNTASVSANETEKNPGDETGSVTSPVANSADLAIVKDADGAATAGATYSWTLAVENAGPSDAVNVVVSDNLPAGTTFRADLSDPRCTAAGPSVSCDLATLAALDSTQLTVGVDVDSGVADGASLTNTASIVSDTNDPDENNNKSTDSAAVERNSELQITKSDVSDPAIAGGQVEWQIVVENLGASDAANVAIADTLPADTVYISVNNAGCAHTSGVVSCAFASLAAGDSITSIITANLDSNIADGTVITNTAEVSSDSSEPVSDSEETTINRLSDLAVTKVSDQTVIAGTDQTYTIEVTNNGPSDAANVTVTDYLPTGVSFVSATNPDCLASGGLVTCSLATVPNQGVVAFDITVAVSDAAGSSARNVVRVTSDSTDPDPINNTANDITEITFEADLDISKRLLTDPLIPGTSAIWEIVVTNGGPSVAPNVLLSDNLDTAVSFNPAGSSAACSATGQLVTCNESALVAGDSVAFIIEADIASDATGALGNAVSVQSDIADPNLDNNESSDSGELAPQADLSLDKTSVETVAVAGEKISYNLVVSNAGPSDAVDVAVSDTVPAGTTFDPATSSSACALVGATVDCSVPTLPSGGEVTFVASFTIDANYESGTNLANSAAVSAATADPDPSNNANGDNTTVETEADLEIVKSGPSTPVAAGTEFSYTIRVANAGPSDAQLLSIVDTLPASTTFVSVDNSACIATGGEVTCGLSTLASGEATLVTVTVEADSNLGGGDVITNRATVSSATNDPNDADNVDTQGTTIERNANLAISKTAAVGAVVAGTELGYELSVENLGPSVSDNVEIVDELPQGSTFVSAAPGCAYGSGIVTCEVGSLATSESARFEVVVLVGSDVANMASLSNSATATGDNSEPATETEETEVDTSADLALLKSLTGSIVAGEETTYRLRLTNFGPSDAQNVTVADALPAGMSYVSDTAGCGAVGGVVSCDFGTVANGESLTFDVTVFVEPFVGDGFELANYAAVTSGTDDPDDVNNTASSSGDAAASADLGITKTLTSETLSAGEVATYGIEVNNDGPSDAQNVLLADVLPAELSFVSAGSDERCRAAATAGASVICDLGTVTTGASETVLIQVEVAADAAGSISNIAEVSSSTSDPTAENNSSESEIDVERNSEAVIEKVLVDGNLTPGTESTWQISVTNVGPATLTDLNLNDILPGELIYLSHSLETSDSADVCEVSRETVECLISEIEAREAAILLITTLVAPESETNEISNSASANSPELSDLVEITVTESIDEIDAELVTTKVGPSAAVEEGETFDWTITVGNQGPQDVTTPIEVVDTLPRGLTYVSHEADEQLECVVDERTISCVAAGLANGGTLELLVATKADTAGVVENSVQVTTSHVTGQDQRSTTTAAVNVVAGVSPATTGVPVLGLAFTGSELLTTLVLALGLIFAGAALLKLRRRSHATTS